MSCGYPRLSGWEVILLAQKGRIELRMDPVEWVVAALRDSPFQEAVLSHRVAIESRLINLPQQDPADRFIAATALVYGFTLVTSDEHLLGCKSILTMSNR